jgi:hypothetical protein
VRRWDPLNNRQLELLQRIASAEDLTSSDHAGLKRSAKALQDRGLVAISGSGAMWQARITDAGTVYLEHGHHPDHPAHRRGDSSAASPPAEHRPPPRPASAQPKPSSSEPAQRSAPRTTQAITEQRRKEAEELVARLVEQRTVRLRDLDEDALTRWRQVIDFAKRHQLVHAGHYIEKRHAPGFLEIRLVAGTHANTRNQVDGELPAVPVPTQLRSLHPVVAELRDDKFRLHMPEVTRRRSLLIFQALAAEAVRRGYLVRSQPASTRYRQSRFQREGELAITIDSFSYAVLLQEESPQSADPERSSRLTLELRYHVPSRRQHRWPDGKRWKVEDRLAAVLHELETRAVEDRQQQIAEEQAKADRQRRWQQAMAEARAKATEAHYAKVLVSQLERRQRADQLRAYCDALEARVRVATKDDDPKVFAAEQWLKWARRYLERLDPLTDLPTVPSEPTLTGDDLKPFLEGWSPNGLEAHLNSWQRLR